MTDGKAAGVTDGLVVIMTRAFDEFKDHFFLSRSSTQLYPKNEVFSLHPSDGIISPRGPGPISLRLFQTLVNQLYSISLNVEGSIQYNCELSF